MQAQQRPTSALEPRRRFACGALPSRKPCEYASYIVVAGISRPGVPFRPASERAKPEKRRPLASSAAYPRTGSGVFPLRLHGSVGPDSWALRESQSLPQMPKPAANSFFESEYSRSFAAPVLPRPGPHLLRHFALPRPIPGPSTHRMARTRTRGVIVALSCRSKHTESSAWA